MSFKKELLEIPPGLQKMYEEGRPLYDAAIRTIAWGERPIFMVGNNSSYLAALSGAWAFESLLGLPVIVRRPSAFSAYTRRAVAVRSLVMAVSATGEGEEILQAAQNAKSRGAIVWAITANPASELAKRADAVVNCYAGDSPPGDCRSIFCMHAAMLFLAVAAARVLKAPAALINTQEEELGKLATHVEWVLDQISDAGSTLANELSAVPKLYVVGGGPFYPAALQAASLLRHLARINASGYEPAHFREDFGQISRPGAGILYLSSSRCKLKEQIHQSLRESRQKGGQKIFAITDNNDHQLSQRSDLAVLLTALTEAGGALLTLAFLELAAGYAAQASNRSASRSQRAERL